MELEEAVSVVWEETFLPVRGLLRERILFLLLEERPEPEPEPLLITLEVAEELD